MIKEYAEIPLVVAMKEDKTLNEVEVLTTVPYLETEAAAVFNLDEVDLELQDTQQECLDAVGKGAADAVLCDGYLSEYLMGTELSYSGMKIKSVLSREHNISIAVRDDNRQLAGILGKMIDVIDARTVSEYMLKSNVYSQMSFERFLRTHSIEIMALLLAVIVVVILVAYHMIKGSRKIQQLMYKDTGMDIWNLNYLIYQGEAKLLPERRGQQYAVVCLNISQFRRFNIIYGWNAGQRLLELVAKNLQNNISKDNEVCARNQGDRFVLLKFPVGRCAY